MQCCFWCQLRVFFGWTAIYCTTVAAAAAAAAVTHCPRFVFFLPLCCAKKSWILLSGASHGSKSKCAGKCWTYLTMGPTSKSDQLEPMSGEFWRGEAVTKLKIEWIPKFDPPLDAPRSELSSALWISAVRHTRDYVRTLNRNVDFGARFAHKHAKSAQILKLFNAVLETICFFCRYFTRFCCRVASRTAFFVENWVFFP